MKKITYANAQKRAVKLTVPMEEIKRSMYYRDNITEEIDLKELARLIEEFLSTQSYESRNVFLRRYWFMDQVPEIASRFFISEKKVRSQLDRTKTRLKKFLIKEGYEL